MPKQEQTPDLPVDNLSSQDVTLAEFCTRLSINDKRVELIAGFEYSEKKAGREKGAEQDFATRFAAFQRQPV